MLTVNIPADVQRILCGVLLSAGIAECGGVLMGEHIGPNQFAVRRLTVQGGGTFMRFVRSVKSALHALSDFFQSANHEYTRFNYLGEWHSHPSFSVQPSNTDHQSMLDIVTDSRIGANFVVLLVFRLVNRGELEGSAHTYLPDGTISRSRLVFEARHDVVTI